MQKEGSFLIYLKAIDLLKGILREVAAASQVALLVKNSPTKYKRHKRYKVRSLGCKDSLEKQKVTHSSILAWKVPWTEEPGGL